MDSEMQQAQGEEMDELEEVGEDGYASSSPASSTQTSTLTWITWFTSLPGHEYFCEVAEEFIEDDFNLTGLQVMVPFWKEALEMVLDVEPEEDSLKIPDVSIVESSAELLYGLVHQRYILTRQGLQAMVHKSFGTCPRVFCHSTAVVPCGRSDIPGLDTVKLYCPNCGDIYSPPSSRYMGVDGAYFGTTFPHLFFQTYRELFPAPFYNPPATKPSTSADNGNGDPAANGNATPVEETVFVNPNPYGGQKAAQGQVYRKRIYGFRVSERARSGPRMAWLRERPTSLEELDRVDWKGRWIDDSDDDDDPHGKGKGKDDASKEKGDLWDGDEEDEDDEEEEEEEEMAPPSNAPAGDQHSRNNKAIVAAAIESFIHQTSVPQPAVMPPAILENSDSEDESALDTPESDGYSKSATKGLPKTLAKFRKTSGNNAGTKKIDYRKFAIVRIKEMESDAEALPVAV